MSKMHHYVFLHLIFTFCLKLTFGQDVFFEREKLYTSSISNLPTSRDFGVPFVNNSINVIDFNGDSLDDILLSGIDSLMVLINKGNYKFDTFNLAYPYKEFTPIHSVAISKHHGKQRVFCLFSDSLTKIFELDFRSTLKSNWKLRNTISCSDCFSNINFLNLNYSNDLFMVISAWKSSTIPFNVYYVDSVLNNSNRELFFFKVLKDTLLEIDLRLYTKQYFPAAFSSYILDLNNDQLLDIYLPGDFNIPDRILVNNGSFFTEDSSVLKSMSYFTMGCVANDINNDGEVDFFCVDMKPRDIKRSKQVVYQTPYNWAQVFKDIDINRQVARNALNIKSGKSFLQISELSNIDATDWSWSALMQDFDNSGFKDLYITNGIINDYMFHYDYPLYTKEDIDILSDITRNMGFMNYMFLNKGQFQFQRQKIQNDIPTVASRAIVCDINNDGLLDIIEHVYPFDFYILKNKSSKEYNFIRFRNDNLEAAIIKICIYSDTLFQCNWHATDKGLYSSSEDIVHFGLSRHQLVDSAKIYWSDNTISILKNLKANQIVSTKSIDKKPYDPQQKVVSRNSFFQSKEMFNFSHTENDFEDFSIDPLLPNKYSRNGPGICVNDFDGDSLLDIAFGNALGQQASVFRQKNRGDFEEAKLPINEADNMSLAFIKNEIVAPPGGYEKPDGQLNGKPLKSSFLSGISAIKTSTSCVAIADYDDDGKEDVFVGGRVSGQKFPTMPRSYLFSEEGGFLKDVTPEDLKYIGMVTSAIWTDFDNDGAMDLIVVGEYMRVEFFKNIKGKLKRYTDNISFGQKMSGFWNSIIGADVNNDGLTDYIVGNLGMNTRYKASQNTPLQLFANDFDGNGSTDVICTFDEDGKTYPMKQLVAYKARINGLAKKYNRVSDFANATFYDLFSPENYKGMLHLKAHELRSGVLINKGNNTFEFQTLPIEAQFSPIYGIYSEDFNEDGNLDIATVGNFHHAEIERGPYTASNGWIFVGDGHGGFKTLSSGQSGFEVQGEGRALAPLDVNGKLNIVATQNNSAAKMFELKGDYEIVTAPKDNKYAIVELANGKIRKQEFYNGAGYLSNYRSLILKNRLVKKITFY